jgi:hypothetical protein
VPLQSRPFAIFSFALPGSRLHWTFAIGALGDRKRIDQEDAQNPVARERLAQVREQGCVVQRRSAIGDDKGEIARLAAKVTSTTWASFTPAQDFSSSSISRFPSGNQCHAASSCV